jgi:xylulose-5-phosphate/fructose-6-phosphate phosphoketolase
MTTATADIKRKTAEASKTTTEARNGASISPYGPARSTIAGQPLSPEELEKIDAYWRASLYVCLGMLYLQDNPLLREPLKIEHVKPRMLGHWARTPARCSPTSTSTD